MYHEIESLVSWSATLLESPAPDYHNVKVQAEIPEFDLKGHITLLVNDTDSGFETFEKVIVAFQKMFVESTVKQLSRNGESEIN